MTLKHGPFGQCKLLVSRWRLRNNPIEPAPYQICCYNANASKPSKSLATLFDERDRLAEVTRNLLPLPWVEHYINLEGTTLPKNSGDLFTLNGLRDANRELLADTPAADWDSTAVHYWKAIAEVIPPWHDVVAAVGKEQAVEAPALREEFVCFHSIPLSALL